jgi:hypothetical protein
MMTEHPTRRRRPLLTLSSLEWKLVLTAALSVVYAFSFVAVARQTAPAPVAVASYPASTVRTADVQPTRVGTIAAAPAPTAPRPAAPRVAQPRIRTRSS